jgi:hypothetical protein
VNGLGGNMALNYISFYQRGMARTKVWRDPVFTFDQFEIAGVVSRYLESVVLKMTDPFLAAATGRGFIDAN